MARSFVPLVLSAALLSVPALAGAQGVPRVKAAKDQQQTTISLQAGQLKVVETLTRDAIDIQLIQDNDVVRFSGDLAGRVTVQRGTRRHSLSVRTATPGDEAAVASLLAGSAALRSFDIVMDTPWGRSARPAAPFRSARALVALFRGNFEPTVAVVSSVASPKVSLAPVRRDGPDACWTAYTHTVVQYTYDLESCVAEARDSWFPLHLGWCAYEYDIKTSLAFAWMLDCYGLL
jgi:hypothetical protein